MQTRNPTGVFLSPSVVTLIAVNVVVLCIAIVQNWNTYDIILTYWTENVVIGIFNLPKILMAEKDHPGKAPTTTGNKVLTVFIFCFHYAFIAVLHLMLIIDSFAPDYPDKTFGTVSIEWDINLLLGMCMLFIGHLISFGTNYIKKKEYKKVSPFQLMMLPYLRVMFVHIFILSAGFFIISMNEPSTSIMIAFMLLKIIVDALSHIAEHKIMNNS